MNTPVTAPQINTQVNAVPRRVVFRTRGMGHGPITRLMSPSDLGQILKPFVFLDIFDFDARAMGGEGMPIHPHSGIATVTVLTQGRMHFDDPESGKGTLAYGGVEWMRAGGGVGTARSFLAQTCRACRAFSCGLRCRRSSKTCSRKVVISKPRRCRRPAPRM
jgi:hypothetical protein